MIRDGRVAGLYAVAPNVVPSAVGERRAILITSGSRLPIGGPARPPAEEGMHVTVVDEKGAQVAGAVDACAVNSEADRRSPVHEEELKIDQPVAGTIDADGYLPEPFIIETPDG